MTARPPAGPPETPRWQQTLTRAWLGRGMLARMLWPLSVLLGALVRLRRWLYRAGVLRTLRLPVPVIVVGNVVAGGAGKTPTVMALVQHLRAAGLHPGVVSRGHGRRLRDCREVTPESLPAEVGDEPALIHRRCGVPVYVAPSRADAARALLERHPETDVIVSDDGLQHLALARDIEICVFDDRGTGNGWLLPAGPLREPWPRPVDLVLHTGRQPAFAGYTAQRALADHAVTHDGRRIGLDVLARQQRPLLAVAGTAQPQAFFAMLRERGLPLARTVARPDHDDFTDWQRPRERDYLVLCTEKDALKLWPRHPDALAVPLAFTPEPAFFNALDALLARVRRGRLSSAHGHPTA
ncbi:MAG: tetraacyldisaccharide 4'-kinase [Hylemonella sp.]